MLPPSPTGTPAPAPCGFPRLVVRRKPDPPSYPLLVRRAGLKGEVRPRLTIRPNGLVSRSEALDGPSPRREAGAAYLRAWNFEPAKPNGVPQDAWSKPAMPFRLH